MGTNPSPEDQLYDDVARHPTGKMDTKKKLIHASEQDEAQRAAFVEHMATLPTQDIVVIDESGTRIGMTPTYGRAPRGQRAVDQAPRNYGQTYSLIAALSLQGMEASMVLEGAVDQTAFVTYLRQFLLPTLRPGQLIIMDNLSVHKGTLVQHVIEAHGCHILFLPPYSPDLSPIEKAFAKIKTFLRRQKALSCEALHDAIAAALQTISPSDAIAWFRHCGYPV